MKRLSKLALIVILYSCSAFAASDCTFEQAKDGANHTSADLIIKMYGYNGWSLDECRVIPLRLAAGSQCNAPIQIMESESFGSNPTYKIVPCLGDENMESDDFFRKLAPNEDPLLR